MDRAALSTDVLWVVPQTVPFVSQKLQEVRFLSVVRTMCLLDSTIDVTCVILLNFHGVLCPCSLHICLYVVLFVAG